MVMYDKMHLLNDAGLNKNTFFQNEPRVSHAQTYLLCKGAQDTGVTVAVMSSLGTR